ncbi:MAG: cytochrome c-type biogenesis protein [Chloroflexota bacterium]
MKYSRITFYVLLLALVLATLLATPALAQGSQPPTDDEVNAIAKQLYCPVCENTPLDVCPTQACAQWRDLIRLMLSQGKSEQEIKDYFVVNYGARVLSEPPRQGLNWLAYLVPPVIIALGAFVLFRAFWAWKRPIAAAPAEGPKTDAPADDYVSRFEEEIRKRN